MVTLPTRSVVLAPDGRIKSFSADADGYTCLKAAVGAQASAVTATRSS